MTSLSTYFHPDDVMLMLAGVLTDGLKYHADAMRYVSAGDQVDEVTYAEAVETAEKAMQCPKIAVASAFRDNKLDVIPKLRVFYKQQVVMSVSFKAMRRKFRKEIARITAVPVLKPSANSNQGNDVQTTASGEELILRVENGRPVSVGNVASMSDWRGVLRKSA